MNYEQANQFLYLTLKKEFEIQLKNESKVILYGFPIPEVSNIGDYMITFGLINLLEDLGKKITIYHHFSNIANVDCPIIFRGGGFWSNSIAWYDYLEKIKEIKNDIKIIIAPMSIFEITNKEKEVFANKQITIYLREKISSDIFINNKIPAINYGILPDTSVGICKILNSHIIKGNRNVALLRNDGEKANIKIDTENLSVFDWMWSTKQMKKINKLSIPETKDYCINFLKQKLDGINSIKTDRLHGFLIPVSIGFDCIIYPNLYHKNVSYFDTWGKFYANGTFKQND